MTFGRTAITSYVRRNSVTILLSIIAFCILAIFALQALTIASLSRQVESQNEALGQLKAIAQDIDRNADESSRQIAGIDRHIDCIVRFYNQTNRGSKAIADIDTCRIAGTGGTSTSNSPSEPRTSRTGGVQAPTGTTSRPSAESPSQGSSEPQRQQPEQPFERPGLIERLTNPIEQLINGLL